MKIKMLQSLYNMVWGFLLQSQSLCLKGMCIYDSDSGTDSKITDKLTQYLTIYSIDVVVKGENASNKHFLLSPQCFHKPTHPVSLNRHSRILKVKIALSFPA